MLQPFFDLEELRNNQTSDPNCEKCKLYRKVNTPRMKHSGKGNLKAFIIGEAPGEKEDLNGSQFDAKAQAGGMLRKHLAKAGLNLDLDFFKHNAINCRPFTEKGNRPPTNAEIAHCRPMCRAAIQETKPTFIILAGGKAVESFFGDRKSKIFTEDLSIGRWRRLCIPDPVLNAWIIPILHPSFPVRQPDYEEIFGMDVKFAIRNLRRKPPEFQDYSKKVKVIQQLDDIVSYLNWVNENSNIVAYDFETNSLKPFFAESKLFTIGISPSPDSAVSFPYQYPGFWGQSELHHIKTAFSKIVRNSNITKVVQNITMEGTWTPVFFTELKGRVYDTAIGSHVKEERDKFTGLKFQVYINWGVIDYDKSVSPFKKPVGKSNFNRLHMVPWGIICVYNGLDGLFTRKLFDVQEKDFTIPSIRAANDFLQNGKTALVKMTIRGIPIDTEYFNEVSKNVSQEIETKNREIMTGPEAEMWRSKEITEFDPNSRDVLEKLLFTHIGLSPIKKTSGGKKNAVDAATLEKINTSFTQMILRNRKLKKINEYLDRCIRLSSYGYIHPAFNLNLATTYRSSSDGPNLHNFPRRDEEAKELIRTGLVAPPGWQFLAADFGAMEVRGLAWYSKDPVLINELINGMDPHGIWAEFLGCSRFDAKNSFVFPLIYGSYWKSIHDTLIFRGYSNVTIELVQEAEEKFWKKYHYAKEWQQRILHDYYKTGYVEAFLGFRRRGVLTRNQIVNFPIQCTCFHCLVWTYNKIDEVSEAEYWQTLQVGQIHDENLLLGKPKEMSHVGSTIERIMTKDVLEWASWINVPPIAEFSLSPEGGNWAQMSDFTKATNNNWESIKGISWEGPPKKADPFLPSPDHLRIGTRFKGNASRLLGDKPGG